MNVYQLNEKLRNVKSYEQLSFLFFKTKRKLRGVLHGKEVAIITIKDGHARYTESNFSLDTSLSSNIVFFIFFLP